MSTAEDEYVKTLQQMVRKHRDVPSATLEEVILYDALAELLDAIDRGDATPWKCEVLE